MSNYEISTVEITFAGGEILNDDRVIKINGELRKKVSLKRMVQVNTQVRPSTFPKTFEEDVKVTKQNKTKQNKTKQIGRASCRERV